MLCLHWSGVLFCHMGHALVRWLRMFAASKVLTQTRAMPSLDLWARMCGPNANAGRTCCTLLVC